MASVLVHTAEENVTLSARAARRLLERGDGDAALLYLKGAIPSPKPDPRLKLRLAKRRQGQFISKVLLLQAAGEAGVVATSNDLEQAWNDIATGYGAPGDANPRATIQSQLRGKLRALLDREVESAALIGAFIAKSAAGKVSVDEAQVEEIIKRGGELKARSRRLLEEQREKALAVLEPMQQADFEGIYEAMEGCPVTIRFLDPPLHEFVPTEEHDIELLAEDLGKSVADIKAIISSLHELQIVDEYHLYVVLLFQSSALCPKFKDS